MKHITASLIALALVVILSATVSAQAQPTRLGLWAQAQGRTANGATIGCNIRPPHSTYCWQHIVDASGKIVATRHRYQLADGRISVYTTTKR
jgi:hypothetical protein